MQKGENEFRLIIPKTHKERFALARKLPLNSNVSVEGIKSKFMIICAKIKAVEAIDNSKQINLDGFNSWNEPHNFPTTHSTILNELCATRGVNLL